MHGSDADDSGAEAAPDDATVEGIAGKGGAGQSGNAPSLEAAIDEAATTPTASRVTLEGADRTERPDRVSSILVAVAGGPHSGATVDVAKAVAETTDAWVDLFHVVPSNGAAEATGRPDDDSDGADHDAAEASGADAIGSGSEATGSWEDDTASGESILTAAETRLGEFDRADRWLVEGRSAAEEIVDQSPYYDLVVVGTPTTGTVGRFVFGCTTDTVVDDADVPVLVVESDEPTPLR